MKPKFEFVTALIHDALVGMEVGGLESCLWEAVVVRDIWERHCGYGHLLFVMLCRLQEVEVKVCVREICGSEKF